MSGALGQGGVLLGFVAALAGMVTLFVGLIAKRATLVRSGGTYAWLILGGALLATASMEYALVTHDFSLEYVAQNGSLSTPLLYTIASLWAALEGSILLWGLVLSAYIAAMVWHFRRRATDPVVGWATFVTFAIAAFFFGLMLGPANPFRTVVGAIATDGPGPNPLLQNHPLMAVHPPILYTGYVGFTIPFAFAMGALITGRVGEGWLTETRKWTLLAWGFLTSGILLGAWWSYEVLGWGGYWAWDPVENASLLPWLTGTAFLHSQMLQERRGMLRLWNISLVLSTFSLTILGTFLTRSGVLDSVHSFTESPIGPLVLALFAATVISALVLIGWRGDRLRAPGSIDSPLSREAAFLANNVLFASFAFIVLLGTVFPLLAEALNGNRLSVGRPYFDRMTMPVALSLLFLMAVAPLLPWRKSSSDLLRNRVQWPARAATAIVVLCVAFGVRGLAPLLAFGLAAFAFTSAVRQLVISFRRRGFRGLLGSSSGGMVVHIGVVVIAVAFAASQSFAHRREFRLNEGESATLAGHTLTYLGTSERTLPNKKEVRATVRVDGGRTYTPRLNQFPFATQAIGTPSVKTGLRGDVYLTLVNPPKSKGGSVVIGVIVAPLVVWLWIGGFIMAAGTAIASLTRQKRSAPSPSGSEAGSPHLSGSAPAISLSEEQPEVLV